MPFIVKNTTFPGLLNLIAPHSCRGCGCIGSVFCDCCKNDFFANHINLCPHCKQPSPTGHCEACHHLPPAYTLGHKSSILGTLIRDYKYHSVRALSHTFASLLDATLPNFQRPVIIVPLPTASHHIRARGFDHTYLLAKKLAHRRGYTVERLLLRRKNTVQVGSSRTTRLAQASQAYTLNPHISPNPTAVYLLLDDVWTTGATMQAAISLLRAAGIKNLAISLLAFSDN